MARRKLSDITFLDILMNALVVFIALFILTVIKIKPSESEPTVKTDGKYIIVVTWDDASEDDVDTYVMDPRGNIVYFRNKEAGLMHLERDDLGKGNDAIFGSRGEKIEVEKNEERVVLRGTIPGEYIVNVHMFFKRDRTTTNVKITLLKLEKPGSPIVEKERVLKYSGDEKTAFRFVIKDDGGVSGISELPRNLINQGWR
jgi:hypothetical protein